MEWTPIRLLQKLLVSLTPTQMPEQFNGRKQPSVKEVLMRRGSDGESFTDPPRSLAGRQCVYPPFPFCPKHSLRIKMFG